MTSKKFGPRTKEQRKSRSKGKSGHASGSGVNDAVADANAAEIIPEQQADAKAARRQQLQDELRAQQSQMSSKKKKRLDKYIENKLKKEESLDLLRKLSLQKTSVAGLQSSRSLSGVRKKRRERGYAAATAAAADGSSDEDEDSDEAIEVEHREIRRGGGESAAKAVERPTLQAPSLALGSGLKRPLERDASGAPIIRKRQRVALPPRFARSTGQPERQETSDAQSTGSKTSDDGGDGSETPWSGISDNDDDGSDGSSDNDSDDGDDDDADFSNLRPELAEKLALIKQLMADGSGSDDESGSGSSELDDDEGSDDEDDNDDDDDDDEEAQNLLGSMFDAVKRAQNSEKGDGDKKATRDVSGFKEWATQQMNEARDFAPSRALDDAVSASVLQSGTQKLGDFVPRALEQDELPPELQVPSKTIERKAHAVLVERTQDIQSVRSKLPVVADEQKIMEAIHNNPVTIVCGATGSGKTTQIPQFLFEAGFGDLTGPTPGMIAVTQPRRVAAVTMAQRVTQELGSHGIKVGYQIRYGTTVSKDTAIKFMTDGVLIREIASDLRLTKYSAIVIDEAHERGVNTDILIGMLSRIVELRSDEHQENPELNKPLKLIVMSATLMADAFLGNSRLFRRGTPPLVQSEGRQYPVTMHFSRRTRREYVDEAFNKIMRGHKKLPSGAMLVFMTGENEILTLGKRLREALGLSNPGSSAKVQIAAGEAPLETEDFDAMNSTTDDYDEESDYGSEDEETEFDIETAEDEVKTTGALILPLHSKLSTKDQLRVFETPPQGTRLIVLATNVAETSITIPGIRYVFDCGRAKEKIYNQDTGVQSFEIGWISKASATQRAGRAGRTGPGHCYRLYSSAVYESDFAEHTDPEILRTPVEGVVLQLKSMDLQHVANFPFPTPPQQQQILQAERLLSYLGAIDSNGKVTNIGRDLSLFPISPRYAKMLAIGHQQDCMLLTIGMVAALATPELFIPQAQLSIMEQSKDDSSIFTNSKMIEENAEEQRRKAFRRSQQLFSALDKHSDAIKLVAAFGAYASAAQTGDTDSFCERMFLRPKAMKEAHQLFQQLVRIVADNRPGLIDRSAQTLPKPSAKQVQALKKIAAVGFIDQVAIRTDLLPAPPDLPKPKRATDVAYMTLFPSSSDRHGGVVYVHSSSVLAQRSVTEMPMYLAYSALQGGAGAAKVRMFPVTNVTDSDLAALARGTPLLEYGKPIGKIEEVAPNKRICWVVPSLTGRRGTMGWPLRRQKVLQRRVNGVWEVEKANV